MAAQYGGIGHNLTSGFLDEKGGWSKEPVQMDHATAASVYQNKLSDKRSGAYKCERVVESVLLSKVWSDEARQAAAEARHRSADANSKTQEANQTDSGSKHTTAAAMHDAARSANEKASAVMQANGEKEQAANFKNAALSHNNQMKFHNDKVIRIVARNAADTNQIDRGYIAQHQR